LGTEQQQQQQQKQLSLPLAPWIIIIISRHRLHRLLIVLLPSLSPFLPSSTTNWSARSNNLLDSLFFFWLHVAKNIY
jgi:hypothetical protein